MIDTVEWTEAGWVELGMHENAQLSLRFIETLGAALPLYEHAFGLRRGASGREDWLRQLSRIGGSTPTPARPTKPRSRAKTPRRSARSWAAGR